MPARTYGTVHAEQQRQMGGLEFVRGLASGELPLNMIAQTLGYDVIEADNGRVVISLVPTEAHLNPAGTVHGGLTGTLLDSCMGLAVQSKLDKGVAQTTLEFKIRCCVPSYRKQARSERKARSCTVVAASAPLRDGSQTAEVDCSLTGRRRASFSRTNDGVGLGRRGGRAGWRAAPPAGRPTRPLLSVVSTPESHHRLGTSPAARGWQLRKSALNQAQCTES